MAKVATMVKLSTPYAILIAFLFLYLGWSLHNYAVIHSMSGDLISFLIEFTMDNTSSSALIPALGGVLVFAERLIKLIKEWKK